MMLLHVHRQIVVQIAQSKGEIGHFYTSATKQNVLFFNQKQVFIGLKQDNSISDGLCRHCCQCEQDFR